MSSKDQISSLFQEEDYDNINATERSIESIDIKAETKTDQEFKQQLEQSILRTTGFWKSKNSEKDIEEIKPVPTREKIIYKWKLPPNRLRSKAEFEDSSKKAIKNQYVKLEPRPKEIYECSDILITDSCVQTGENMVDREMQTVLGTKDNKCIQSVTEDEDMFQLQPLKGQNKALDDFLKTHVPNLVNQLHHNQLYDLYRDDYKQLVTDEKRKIQQNTTSVTLLPTAYHNPLSPKRYVSSLSWHPTIPGVFAVSYTTNHISLYKSINLETSDEEISQTTVEENHGISFENDGNNIDSWNKELGVEISDRTYKEKIVFLLNKEFVQKMRIIQIIEHEKTNEKQYPHIINQQDFRNSFVFNSYDDLSPEDETYIDEAQDEQMETFNATNMSQSIVSNSNIKFSTLEKEYTSEEEDKKTKTKKTKTKDKPDHHDSDTESFYNIWGDDEEWSYGNKLRNVVRNIHREFNTKYDREAKENTLFNLLESDAENSKTKENNENMSNERMKLTKDLFEAGDIYKTIRSQSEMKYKKILSSKKQNKILENDKDSIIKRENTKIVDESSNSVIIWSMNDHVFPKLRLESPQEVCCVEFNPRDGNTVIGGLINGQICIWDMTGKLEVLDSSMSGKEKKHHNHLSMHMKWSLDVMFKTRMRPTAYTAILESHDSMVTAIQWIHPMSKVTRLGKLVSMPEEKFSMQFMSASMDGTIRIWDLQSMLVPKLDQKSVTKIRSENLKNLNAYKSPLDIYNNRLVPTYTIVVKQSEYSKFSHITSMSFETPLMQFKYTSDKPLVIGEQQFEYVPKAPEFLNRTIIVGNMMGRIGVLTWNGYDTYQKDGNREECKFIWGKHMHDGPVICIRRNAFYPDIYIMCGGHIVSVWSLKHRHDPIWWKRFDNTVNNVIWSTFRPLGFRLCFNKSSELQFWNLMDYTYKPIYTTDIILGESILTLTASRSPMRYLDDDKITFSGGIHEVLNFKKNELISLSKYDGTVIIVSIDLKALTVDEIERIRQVIKKEISRKIELHAWNENYSKEFGIAEQKILDNYNYNASAIVEENTAVQDDNDKLNKLKAQLLEKQIREDTYQWYINRRGPNTRLGKMKENYLEREKQYMVDTILKRMDINKYQIDEYFEEMKEKTHDQDLIEKLRYNGEEKNKHELSNKKNNELVFDNYSSNTVHLNSAKKNIYQLLGTDFQSEKEKLKEYIKNNTYEELEQDWSNVIESAIMLGITISDLLKNPSFLRQQSHMIYTFEEEEGLFE